MIKLSNIAKSFKEFNLHNINLEINHGEFVTLLGESGSGKSTLLKIILGLVDDYQGSVIIDNKISKGISPVDNSISMVFQHPLLLPHLNVEDNISFGLEMTKIPKIEQQKRIHKVIEELRLNGFEKRHPYELSGGQMQRVAIARALVMQPKVLLMDEPFSALDQNLRLEMQKLLKEIQKHHKCTIVFVTHDRDEAFYLSDKIAIINKGQITQFDTPSVLYTNPKDVYTANFLGITNIFNGYLSDGKFEHKDFSLHISNDTPRQNCTIAIKSNDLHITSDKTNEYSITGILSSIVIRSGLYELDVTVGVDNFKITQSYISKSLQVGEEVFLNYTPDSIIIFN